MQAELSLRNGAVSRREFQRDLLFKTQNIFKCLRVCGALNALYMGRAVERYRYADGGGSPQYSFWVVPRSLCCASNE